MENSIPNSSEVEYESFSREVRPRRARWIALAGIVVTASSSAWFYNGLDGVRSSDLILMVEFLLCALCGLLTLIAALVGLRNSVVWQRIAMIVIALGSLALAGWHAFIVLMIAMFPPC